MTDLPQLDKPPPQIGDNGPPPHLDLQQEIDDLLLEAGAWLDGEKLETQAQADALSLIVTGLRKRRKAADEKRKELNKPFDEGKAANQAIWNPILKKADLAMKTGKAVITEFLEAEAAEVERKAEVARKAALEAEQRLRKTERLADDTNLEDQQAIEQEREQVKRANKSADRLAKAKPKLAGEGRAMSLRTYYDAKIVDRRALLNWVAKNDPEWLESRLQEYAQSKVSVSKTGFAGVEAVPRKAAA